MAKEVQVTLTGKNAQEFLKIKRELESTLGLSLTNVQTFMYVVRLGDAMKKTAE